MNKQAILKQKIRTLEQAQLQLEDNINQLEIEWEETEKQIQKLNRDLESHNVYKQMFKNILMP